MSDPKNPTPEDKAAKAMTLEQAAKAVKRTTVLTVPGAEPKTVTKPIPASEVLSFKDYGAHVVVVTTDGQKFSSAPAEAAA